MAIVGYVQVSSIGQSLDVQLTKLKHCDKMFWEKQSGNHVTTVAPRVTSIRVSLQRRPAVLRRHPFRLGRIADEQA